MSCLLFTAVLNLADVNGYTGLKMGEKSYQPLRQRKIECRRGRERSGVWGFAAPAPGVLQGQPAGTAAPGFAVGPSIVPAARAAAADQLHRGSSRWGGSARQGLVELFCGELAVEFGARATGVLVFCLDLALNRCL